MRFATTSGAFFNQNIWGTNSAQFKVFLKFGDMFPVKRNGLLRLRYKQPS